MAGEACSGARQLHLAMTRTGKETAACQLPPTWSPCATASASPPTSICPTAPARSRSSWSARRTDGTRPAAAELTAADRTPATPRRDRRLLHRAWLCRGLSGHARPLRLGRPLREVPVGWRGRLRRLHLAARPVLVRRAHLHHGPVLCGAHAGGAGLPRSARPGGAGAGLRRLRQLLEVRHPPVRRVRAEAGDLGVQECAGVAGGAGRPGAAGGAGGRGHPRLVHPHALEARPLAAAPPSRTTRPTCSTNGRTARTTRFWQQLGIWTEGLSRAVFARRLRAHVVVVGPVSADRDQQLHRPEARRPRAAAADPRAVDAWRPQQPLLRRCGVRAGCAARFLGRRLARVSAAVLRSRGEGRGAGRAGGAGVRHGRRHRAGATRRGTWSMAGGGSPPTIGRRLGSISRRSTCMATAGWTAPRRRPGRRRCRTISTRRIRCRRSAGQ